MGVLYSISYHASGFQIRDIPSPVGLGWVLNAGGLITRSVECIPDFKSSSLYPKDAFNFTSAAQIDSLKNGTQKWHYADGNYYMDMSKWESFQYWEDDFFNTRNGQGFDTRSDRYTYNFLGNSGVARYDVSNNELKPVPYNPIKIVRAAENRYVITDTKGIKYEFSYPETSANPNVQYSAVTGWYLTKITYPGRESDSIVFSYKNATPYYQTIYTQTTSIIHAIDRGSIQSVSTSFSPIIGKTTTITPTGYSYYSPVITSIKWRGVTVEFNYATDRKDQRKERLTSVAVKDGSKIIKQALLHNNDYFGTNAKNYRLRLDDISLCGSDTMSNRETYTFNYNNTISPPDYSGSENPYCQEDYWGYYNGPKSIYFFSKEIAKGVVNVWANSPVAYYAEGFYTNETTNRNPNEQYTKVCMLEEIVYPTKGKTKFEYEINRIPNFYAKIGSQSDIVGGLRLKKRTNYSETGSTINTKEYEYEGYPVIQLIYDMFIGNIVNIYQYTWVTGLSTHNGNDIETVANDYGVYRTQLCNSSPFLSMTGWFSSPVFYNKVTEYDGEKANNNNIGKTVYTYAEDQSQSDLTDAPYDIVGGYTPVYFSVYDDWDKGYIKELPVSTIRFNKNGDTVKAIHSRYHLYKLASLHTGVHVAQINNFQSPIIGILDATYLYQSLFFQQYYINGIVSVDNYAIQQVSLPESTTETDYVNGKPAITNTKSYDYAVKNGKPISFQPSVIMHTNSNGINHTEQIKYPFDYTVAPYTDMVAANIIDPVINRTETSSNGTSQTIQNNYRKDGSQFVIDNVQTGKNGVLEKRLSFPNYDNLR